ncbi:MarR family winged helix-turn-helix transcriptional regulator [Streptomyces profundus]|nr:MarR family winged helix-turn-helix transcriptional regulator [Streptomyces sp. MA3_2.13]
MGTRLRHLLDLLENDLADVYPSLGLTDYRPRFTPAIRALTARGPSTIRELAEALSVTHSAASQTVAQLVRRGLVELSVGEDARQRVVRLTEEAEAMRSVLEREWALAEAAVADLDAELSVPLARSLTELEEALARRSFRDRVAEAAARMEGPPVGEGADASPRGPRGTRPNGAADDAARGRAGQDDAHEHSGAGQQPAEPVRGVGGR